MFTSRTAPAEDDLGLLDLVDMGSEQLNNLTEVTLRMNGAMTGLAEKMRERTAELEAAKSDDQRKRVVNRAAADLEDFVARMDPDVTQLARSAERGLGATARAVELSTDFGEGGNAQARALLEPIGELKATIDKIRPTFIRMRQSIVTLPRLTAPLNRAKRAAVDVIARLESELEKLVRMCGEVEKVILSLPG